MQASRELVGEQGPLKDMAVERTSIQTHARDMHCGILKQLSGYEG